jgi:uncharacterized protein YqiB (DUF1249 family)
MRGAPGAGPGHRLRHQGDVAAAEACTTQHLERIKASLELSADKPQRQLDLVNALQA